MALVASIALAGCNNPKAEGENYAKQLDELCQQQNDEAAIALEAKIEQREQELAGNSEALAQFREAIDKVRERNVAYMAALKAKQGIVTADSAVNEVVQGIFSSDSDQTVSISDVSRTIDAVNNKK